MSQYDLDAQTLDPSLAGDGDVLATQVVLTIAGHVDLGRVGDTAVLGRQARFWGEVSRSTPMFNDGSSGRVAPLGDLYLSRKPAILITARGTGVEVTRSHPKMRIRIDGALLEEAQTLEDAALQNGVVIELARRVVLVLHLRDPLQHAGPDHGLVGDSDGIRAVRASIDRVAGLDVPVLVRGETGTGKELVSQAVHRGGPRAAGPFVAVNMAAVPHQLAASELFGHVKGAFSGATADRRGRFREAHGGTLFLDELGETPEAVQAMLLRVLETHRVRPVGGEHEHTVDVRLVAATDADLEGEIAGGRFKAPLLHRVSGYRILIPPLRRRREDIGRLIATFLTDEAERCGAGDRLVGGDPKHPWLPSRVVAALVRHDWPGNVRELRNTVRQMVVEGIGEPALKLDPAMLAPPPSPAASSAPPASLASSRPGGPRGPVDVSEEQLVEALRATGYRRGAAAKRLGIARSTLYALVEKSSRVRKVGEIGPDEIRQAAVQHDNDTRAMAKQLEVSERGLKLRMSELGMS